MTDTPNTADTLTAIAASASRIRAGITTASVTPDPQQELVQRPDLTAVETAEPVVQPVATVAETEPPTWLAPFRSEDATVYDQEGRLVCICHSAQPHGTKVLGAKRIADALNRQMNMGEVLGTV